MTNQQLEHWFWKVAIATIGAVYLLNLRLDVMEIDAAQYASIAAEMAQNGSFLEVFHRGNDYLDKPPLLFWLSAFCFKILGFNNFAYKLPTFLALILGIYSTFHFTKKYYSLEKAKIATLILATCQAYFQMTNDVRTDGLLTGLVVFSIWQIDNFIDQKKWKYLFGGSLGIALAMMAKGPIGLILPAAAFVGHWLLQRNWRNFFRWEWLISLFLIALCLLPMSIGLYTQFDLHPEKTVYGLDGPSGLRFFYWTQSFGRITGEIYWDNGLPKYFFLQSILWDFTPWVFLFFPAFFGRLKMLFSQKFKSSSSQEWLSFSCFLLGFIAFSLSNYKLPHYIFPLFPFAAIISSDWLVNLYSQKSNFYQTLNYVYFSISNLLFLIFPIAVVLFFDLKNYLIVLLWLSMLIMSWWLFLKFENGFKKLVFPLVIASIQLGFVLSLYFYPSILPFQSGSEIAHDFSKTTVPFENHFYFSEKNILHSLDFYHGLFLKNIEEKIENLPLGSSVVLISEEDIFKLENKHSVSFKILKTYPSYRITRLKWQFLNKKTRTQTLKNVHLVAIEKQKSTF